MCKHDLDGKYIPQNFEDELYKEWEDKGILNLVWIKIKSLIV